MNREKVIKALEERISTCSMIGDGFDVVLNWKLADDILSLLKEQEEEIENLKQTAQSMMEGVCLLKDQPQIVRCKGLQAQTQRTRLGNI